MKTRYSWIVSSFWGYWRLSPFRIRIRSASLHGME